jgi:small subunit ribosomal protein S21
MSPAVLALFLVRASHLEWTMEVTLNETDRLEVVLKKFNRQITKAGLFQDMKKKRFYESPAVQRRRKSKAARRRNRTR